MAKITYEDKVGIIPRTVHINQVWDDDMTEIKDVVNGLDFSINEIGAGEFQPIFVSAIWVSGFIFDCTADSYPINNLYFSAPAVQLTLSASDGSLDRIDLIVAKIPVDPAVVGTIQIIEGDLATPTLVVPRDYDRSTYFVIKQILVKANSTTPDGTFSNEIVYAAGTGQPNEWTFASSAGSIVNSGGIIDATNPVAGDKATMMNDTTVDGLNSDRKFSLAFDLTLKENPTDNYQIVVKLLNSAGGVITQPLYIPNNTYGFDKTDTGQQTITIDGGNFVFTSIADVWGVQIYPYLTFDGYELDNITFNIGSETTTTVISGIEEAPEDDIRYLRKNKSWVADLILPNNLSWGESYINNWRDLVLDDGATYFPNNGGYEKGRLHQAGIIPSLHFIPAAVKEAVLYSIGKNRTNDLTVDRNSIATYVDEDGIVQTALADVARIGYTDGDGAILAEDEGINLMKRSESVGNLYWIKSGATIEGDASTAGSTFIVNGDFTSGITGWSGRNATVSHISGGVLGANSLQAIQTLFGGDAFTSLSSNISGTATVRITMSVVVTARDGTTQSLRIGLIDTDGVTRIYVIHSEPTQGTIYNVDITLNLSSLFEYESFIVYMTRNDAIFQIADVTITEVQGFSAPDGSLNAYKLVATGTNGYIQLASAETILNATSYTNSIFIKRAIGTGNILIKDINNAETNVSTLIGVELADNWTRYDITDTSSSTSGQIGVKLATSGDEVYIFGADLKEDLGSSYIKSDSGSSTPRLADVFTNSGDSNTFNSVSGSFKVNIRALSNDLTVRVISINDGTGGNAITIGYNNVSNTILAEYIISSSTVASLSYQVSDITDYHDVEFQYALNDFKLLIDDVERDTDVSGAVLSADTLDSLDYHNGAGSDSFYGKVKQKVILK